MQRSIRESKKVNKNGVNDQRGGGTAHLVNV